MAEYNPSKIIKDGNTYNFRDTTKIPLAGSNQISGDLIPATDGTVNLGSSSKQFNTIHSTAIVNHGTGIELGLYNTNGGADMALCPKEYYDGFFRIRAYDGTTRRTLQGFANGTLTWNGQPIQTSSDQRLKQQIAEIDDKLLDAWEDVNLVQFKYNDAVKEKSDNARLHTGYVVQQIDKACQSHGVDISAYGLYCHEEYAEETREIEHDDGTKTIEVVRPASEHYSLRYTEALIVECAYLRKCIKELRTEIEQLKSSK